MDSIFSKITKYKKLLQSNKLDKDDELDRLIIRFTELVKFCEAQSVSVEQSKITNSDLVTKLTKKLDSVLPNRLLKFNEIMARDSFKQFFERLFLNSISLLMPAIVNTAIFVAAITSDGFKIKGNVRQRWYAWGFFLSNIVMCSLQLCFSFLIFKFFNKNELFILHSYLSLPVSIFISICAFLLNEYQSETTEYQLSKALYKKLSLKNKIFYLCLFSGIFKPKDEFDFFKKHLPKNIINETRRDLIENRFCNRVKKLANDHFLISNIHSRKEANGILKKLHLLKQKQSDEIDKYLTL